MPATSEPADGNAAAARFGRGLAHRMNPQVTVIRRSVVQPGFIARRSVAFGSYVGQSQVSRWTIGTTMNRGALAVRPPIDYWPWATTEEPTPTEVPRVQRGLPKMEQLRRRTDGKPGTMAKAMRPEVLDLSSRGQSRQQQAKPRNDAESFKAMLQRTGRIPGGNAETAAPASGSVDAGRFRTASPGSGAAPAAGASTASPFSAVPFSSAAPTGPAAAGSVAPGRTAPTARPAPAPVSLAGATGTMDAPDRAGRDAATPGTNANPPAPATATPLRRPPTTIGRASGTPISQPAASAPTGAGSAQAADGTVRAADLAARLEARQRNTGVTERPSTAGTTHGSNPAARDSTASTTTDSTPPPARPVAPGTTEPLDVRSAPVAPAGVLQRTEQQDDNRADRTTATATEPRTRPEPAHDSVPQQFGMPLTGRRPVVPTPVSAVTTGPTGGRPASGATPQQPMTTTERATERPTAQTSGDSAGATGRSATPAPDTTPTIMRSTEPSLATATHATGDTLTPAPPLTATSGATTRATPGNSTVVLPAAQPSQPRDPDRERSRQRPQATDRTAFTPSPPSRAAEPSSPATAGLSPATAPRSSAPPVHQPAVDAVRTVQVDRPAGPIDRIDPLPENSRTDVIARALATIAPPAAASAPTDRLTTAAPRSVDSSSNAPGAGRQPAGAVAVAPRETTAERRPPDVRPTPDRFLEVLQASPAPTLRPLPARFAPLARTVLGHTDVHVRHDAGSQAALAAVGKRAATTGNVIHLSRQPSSAADHEVLAHELTHVAHLSPAPRFFDDDRHSAEERQAEQVAHLIQRSPSLLATRPGAAPLAIARTAAPAVPNGSAPSAATPSSVQRATAAGSAGTAAGATPSSPLGPLTPPPPRGTPAAAAPGAPSVSATRPLTIRRSPDRSKPAPAPTPAVTASAPASVQRTAAPAMRASDGSGVVQRAVSGDSGSGGGTGNDSGDTPAYDIIGGLHRTGGVVDFVDWIVEQVEDRVVAELQRRGGRYREDF